MTTWVPCVKRREIQRIEKDGSTSVIMRCAHTAASRFNTSLTPADCAACPLRLLTHDIRPPDYTELVLHKREYAEPRINQDGSMQYEKNGLKPPSVPEGYAKTEDAWVFLPMFPACADREAANTVQRCGCIKTSAMCASKESNMHGLKVAPEGCSACPVRRLLQID